MFLLVLWRTYGECENYASLSGHKGAILDLHFSTDGDYMFTASTVKSVMMWDSHTGAKIKKYKGHLGIVNCVNPSRHSTLFCSGSDDCAIKLWDTRLRGMTTSFRDKYQITAVTFNESADQIVAAGIENVLKVYDLQKNDVLYTMSGYVKEICFNN